MTESRTFDPLWEEKHSSGHMERYPGDSVVSFVFKNFSRYNPRSAVRLLEVACGIGFNLWFALHEGLSVLGIERNRISPAENCKIELGFKLSMDIL